MVSLPINDSVGTGAASPVASRRRYVIETFSGADDALAALDAVQREVRGGPFQSLDWLTALYEELSAVQEATPFVIVATDASSDMTAMVLPLVIVQHGRIRIARFADLGVSDYGAPLLGPAAPVDAGEQRRVWRAMRRAVDTVDVVHLERMGAANTALPNPLLQCRGLVPSQHSGFFLDVSEPVDQFIAGRGKKYRKEVERCMRVWQKESGARFMQCRSADEAAHVYAALEDQQSARHAGSGKAYILDDAAYRAFYERIAVDGGQSGLARLFALEAGGEIAATLFGIVRDGTFVLLRITTAGEAVSHFSPGRLIILEAMRSLKQEGVTRFDMGIGDYPFKRGFGVAEVALQDLIVARTARGQVHAGLLRLKRRLRKNPTVQAMRRRLSGRAASGAYD